MSAPEETRPFRELRQAHKAQTRLVREQSRQIREAEERERRMRVQITTLPDPALKAAAKVIRKRSDLSMSEALALVSEAFSHE